MHPGKEPALRLVPALVLILFPVITPAQTYTDIDWKLWAIDGQVTDAPASLRLGEDEVVSGTAPCNSWSSRNDATFPVLQLRAIRATRRACDQLAEEQAFFNALAAMTELRLDGASNLILTGPKGRRMEFVIDRTNSLTACTTCPKE